MANVTLDCSYCYNKTDIEYEIDEDGEWETPKFCPFCGIAESEEYDLEEDEEEDYSYDE